MNAVCSWVLRENKEQEPSCSLSVCQWLELDLVDEEGRSQTNIGRTQLDNRNVAQQVAMPNLLNLGAPCKYLLAKGYSFDDVV